MSGSKRTGGDHEPYHPVPAREGNRQRRDEAPARRYPARYLAFSGMRRPVVFWNLTDRCNLSCTHCYSRSAPDSQIQGELSTTEALAFIDNLAAAGIPLVIFTGGEPLVRPDIWQLADHSREAGIKTALSTNGTLITDEVAGRSRPAGSSTQGSRLTGQPHKPMTVSGTPGALPGPTAFSRCERPGPARGPDDPE